MKEWQNYISWKSASYVTMVTNFRENLRVNHLWTDEARSDKPTSFQKQFFCIQHCILTNIGRILINFLGSSLTYYHKKRIRLKKPLWPKFWKLPKFPDFLKAAQDQSKCSIYTNCNYSVCKLVLLDKNKPFGVRSSRHGL